MVKQMAEQDRRSRCRWMGLKHNVQILQSPENILLLWFFWLHPRWLPMQQATQRHFPSVSPAHLTPHLTFILAGHDQPGGSSGTEGLDLSHCWGDVKGIFSNTCPLRTQDPEAPPWTSRTHLLAPREEKRSLKNNLYLVFSQKGKGKMNPGKPSSPGFFLILKWRILVDNSK